MFFTLSAFNTYAADAADKTGAVSIQQVKTAAKKKNGWVVKKNGKKKYLKNGKYVKNKVIKIKDYRYYFNKKGYLVTGKTVKYKKKKLYLSNRGRLRAYSKNDKFFFQNGDKMSKAEKEDFKCRLKAEAIAEDITNDDMSKKEKLITFILNILNSI